MTIKTATFNGVATIEIARPEKKNALTVAMYQAMADALAAAQRGTFGVKHARRCPPHPGPCPHTS